MALGKPIKISIALPLLMLFGFTVWASSRRPAPKPSDHKEQQTPKLSSEESASASTSMQGPPSAYTSPVMPTGGWPELAIFIAVHPEGSAGDILEFLENQPNLNLTLIFPPSYFNNETNRDLLGEFSLRQSSKTLEVALTLENEPNLPLLDNLSNAGNTVQKWGFNYAWPEDVAAQIARGSARYQKRWGHLPSGLTPPYLSLTESVVNTVKKFRLNWVLGRPQDRWGIRFYGGTTLVIPPKPPTIDELTLGGKVWAEKMADWTLGYPFVFIDTTQLEDPKAEIYYLEEVVKKITPKKPQRLFLTAETWTQSLGDAFDLPKDITPFENDFSSWVTSSQQRRAWAAIADARLAIETYQKSGRANLQRLDAAIEEMANAQSGEFLLRLGSIAPPTGPLSDRPVDERNFLATLGNVYRLCETAVPSNLNTWFATRSAIKSTPKSDSMEGPFFIEGPNSLTWNDSKNDDDGNGSYTYPVGPYPKGMFDLKELTLSWNDEEINITASVQEPFLGKPLSVLPAIDLYIDVNRLPNAGSTNGLGGRGKTNTAREAAWEYAVAFSPRSATIYQSIPGESPRTLGKKSVDASGKSFSTTFPRSLLRGDPRQWRFSAGLMGIENSQKQETPTPVSIVYNATEKNFGGAQIKQSAPYIDILSPSIEDQTDRMKSHFEGGPLSLPFVEAQ
ncbi:MAG: hypothetical protein KCHDKBKB_02211 [Elusimicrobia bacterium]|nr:hypothetical protein [Elusimicrobiota bacterium]